MNNSVNKKRRRTSALLGAASGIINGLLGSGGGTIAVFGMQRYAGVETHKSHATAVAVILPMSLISLVVYLRNGLPDLRMLLYVSAGGVMGGFIGAKLLNKLKAAWLHKAFGIFMILAAVRMLF